MIKKIITHNWELENLSYSEDADGYCIDIIDIELNFKFRIVYLAQEKNKLQLYIPLIHQLQHVGEYVKVKSKLTDDIDELIHIIQLMIMKD